MKYCTSIWLKSVLLCLLLSNLFICQPLQAQEAAAVTKTDQLWKAGVARTVITPREYMWMAGFAARDKPAEGILHDLWAKALALEDTHGNRVLLVTTDLIGFDRELSLSICKRLEDEYQLERKNIILSSSHTHSGPVVNINLLGIYPPFDAHQKKQVVENRHFIEEQVVVVAGRAINSLSPVRLSSNVGIARFAVNRRENKWDNETLYKSDLKGPSDYTVPVIKVSDPQGKPVAVIFGYSCHATTLNINSWSGDYPGFAQIELEKTYPGLTAMFFAGFGADQNALPRGGISRAEQYGKELAVAVERTMKEPGKELKASLITNYSEIALDLAPPPGNEELNDAMKNGSDWKRRWAKNTLDKIDSGVEMPGFYPFYPIQSWQLGDQTLVSLGGEVVVDYAFKLREMLGNDLMLMGYANDVMAYIPSERILNEGRYEGEESMWVYGHHGKWEPGIEGKVVSEVVRQVRIIRKEAGKP